MARLLRTDIQGLRALAVSLVVVFHLCPTALSGGYVGVDIFFVISGFLITAHLLREVQATGTIHLRTFWARRIRRLLPAAIAVLLVAYAVALWLMPPSTVVPNLTQIAFASIYLLNWDLAGSAVDYLASDDAPTLVQHYWSLSVEEQFYAAWPLILLATIFVGHALRRSLRQSILFAAIVVFVASFVWSVTLTNASPAPAYFVTTTRAWEFAAGGLIAFAPALARLSSLARTCLSWLAASVLVVTALTFDASTKFPGWIAIWPVAATALLIWVGDIDGRAAPQSLARNPPVQLVGRLSYSIYLWHWPLIVIAQTLLGHDPGLAVSAALLAATLALAWLTDRFVEAPLRRGEGLLSSPRRAFTFMTASTVCLILIAIVPLKSYEADTVSALAAKQTAAADSSTCFGANAIMNGCPRPFALTDAVDTGLAATDGYAKHGPAATDDCVGTFISGSTNLHCTLATGTPDSASYVLVGDSHADQYLSPLQSLAIEQGWSLASMTRPACSGFEESASPCAAWGDDVYTQLIQDHSVDTVIIALRTTLYSEPTLHSLVDERVQALVTGGKKVFIVRDVPGMEPGQGSGPSCIEASIQQSDPCSWQPDSTTDWLTAAALENSGVLLDTWEVLCGVDGECHALIGEQVVYFDSNHLTDLFARSMTGWFRHVLTEAREVR